MRERNRGSTGFQVKSIDLEAIMPIILWLLGVPLTLVILLWLIGIV